MSEKKPTKQNPPPQVIEFNRRPDESERDAFGRNVIRPEIGGASTIKAYSGKLGVDVEIMGLVTALSSQARAVNDGDLKTVESMLAVQATTLDALFNSLAQRAALNMVEYLPAGETYLRLAFKAQSQCRATLETLANIKNPPVIYARQANIANGPQLVNNGHAATGGEIDAGMHTHTGKSSIPPNELLEGLMQPHGDLVPAPETAKEEEI